jgi:hypothetical protein
MTTNANRQTAGNSPAAAQKSESLHTNFTAIPHGQQGNAPLTLAKRKELEKRLSAAISADDPQEVARLLDIADGKPDVGQEA